MHLRDAQQGVEGQAIHEPVTSVGEGVIGMQAAVEGVQLLFGERHFGCDASTGPTRLDQPRTSFL